LYVARIHYPCHPYFGQEVGVLARRRSSGTLHVLLPDDTTTTLPEWMFDKGYCATLVWRDRPALSLAALRDLRRLLDAVSPERNSLRKKKDRWLHDEPSAEAKNPLVSRATDLRKDAGENEDRMSPFVGAIAARSDGGGKIGIRRGTAR
jgi:hypothetical protein